MLIIRPKNVREGFKEKSIYFLSLKKSNWVRECSVRVWGRGRNGHSMRYREPCKERHEKVCVGMSCGCSGVAWVKGACGKLIGNNHRRVSRNQTVIGNRELLKHNLLYQYD